MTEEGELHNGAIEIAIAAVVPSLLLLSTTCPIYVDPISKQSKAAIMSA